MVEIYKNLWVGSATDYEGQVKKESGEYVDKSLWRVVRACKEPYHRQTLDYGGKDVFKDHPECLVRDNLITLNLEDSDNPNHISRFCIESALEYIDKSLKENYRVLICCDYGKSCSPSIGLLYLRFYTKVFGRDGFMESELKFVKIYPRYRPSIGVRLFMKSDWRYYEGKLG